MHAPALTRQQQRVLEALLDRHARAQSPPTLDELCRSLGLRSRGSLHKHVQALIQAGLVEPLGARQRGVRLRVEVLSELDGVPFFGYIAAGRPIEAIENPQTLDVPNFLRTGSECYVLQVKGDSMLEDGILDGDWVVVERREHARNGEIVVALVDGEEATLKRIEQSPGRCTLMPANGDYEPMVYAPDRVRVQGIVIGQMRSYR